MTNLDRLKGSPYLLDGFESFLRKWMAPDEPVDPNSQMELFDPGVPLGSRRETPKMLLHRLPSEVQLFYEIINRWPRAGIRSTAFDQLIYPPQKAYYWDLAKSRIVRNDESKRVLLVKGQEGRFVVMMSIAERDFGQLYTNIDRNHKRVASLGMLKMETPVAEFLLTFALLALMHHHYENAVMEPSGIEGSRPLFQGAYHSDITWNFSYHPEGALWLQDEQGRVHFGTRRLEPPPSSDT